MLSQVAPTDAGAVGNGGRCCSLSRQVGAKRGAQMFPLWDLSWECLFSALPERKGKPEGTWLLSRDVLSPH